jgi:hypothetical protein
MQTLSPTSNTKTSHRVTYAETEQTSAIARSSVLQTALNGLDANLNDELDRYHHWQENGQTISYLNPFRPRAVSENSLWTAASLAELAPIAANEDFNGNSKHPNSASTLKMPMMPTLSAMPPINNQVSEFSNLSYENLADLEAYVAQQSQRQSNGQINGQNTTESLNISAPEIAKPIAQPSTLDDDDILQNFANDYAEYYGNNEQSAAETVPPMPNPPKSALHSLLNPVGIISLLLLLCSSAAIGYLLVDPTSVMKLFKPDNGSNSSQSLADPNAVGNASNKVDQSLLDPVPFMGGDRTLTSLSDLNSNLNKDAKTDLKIDKSASIINSNSVAKPSGLFVPNSNPSSLRVVPSTNFPRSTAIAAAPLPPVLAPIQSDPEPISRANPPARETYREPAPQPVRRANPRVSTPSVTRSAPAATTPVTPSVAAPARTSVRYAAPLSAAPQPAPQPLTSYRVVVENGYAASAQQVERDAFVRPDGQVQVGSYRDPNAAQQSLEQLRRQGIPARIE